ncbi:protein PLANT CADMIUM RESISTANCE 2-like [Rhodamnia argentea]|uniref:Protein PLANT CADMIUM RESISTANCE 2-like n=1 Tax=Rhodamnia argentea TaxID=178133 RepID=A0A8B8P2Z0_9MYRT|nr:protein PLANT CADMIUM RESISTANCE 2-like [Rhodamnia argentea]
MSSSSKPYDAEGQPWSTGLCDCFTDVKSCCITIWCPCITFGRISEIVDKGTSSCIANGAIFALIHHLTLCACLYSCLYRTKLKQEFGLRENRCHDCLAHTFCLYCALCQEYRELKSRGFDMERGWEGNARQQKELAMAPKVEGDMRR